MTRWPAFVNWPLFVLQSQGCSTQLQTFTLTALPGLSRLISLMTDLPIATRSPHFFQSMELSRLRERSDLLFEGSLGTSKLSVDCCFFEFLEDLVGLIGRPAATRCDMSSIAYSASLGTSHKGVGNLLFAIKTGRGKEVNSAYLRLSEGGNDAIIGITCQYINPRTKKANFAI